MPLPIDGRLKAACWSQEKAMPLLGLPPNGGKADSVQLVADDEWLYVGARLDASAGPVQVEAPNGDTASSRLLLRSEHLRVVVSDGKDVWSFALAPTQGRYAQHGRAEDTDTSWRGVAGAADRGWQAEIAIPRKLLPDLNKARVNIVHHCSVPGGFVDYELSPGYALGNNADVIPDWRPSTAVEGLARLRLP
jgi:hypothetical protein